jgi:heptosyltransferase-2
MSERILVVGPAWVGDMVMAQSLFLTLADLPGTETDVVAPAWSVSLTRRMPEVCDAIELPVGHGQLGWSARRHLGNSLRKKAYSRAIVLPRSFKAALVPLHARVPVRTGYLGEMRFGLLNDIRPLDRNVLTRNVERYVALGLPADASAPPAVPQPSLQTDSDNQARLLARLDLNQNRPVLAMMPGAEYGPAKQWPPGSFAAVAREMGGRGYQVWVLGSDRDAQAGREIAEGSEGAAINLCGRTRLLDAVDLLGLAEQAVANDSGLMHVAAAVGCRVVALYGSTSPAFAPPLTDRGQTLYLGLDCSPCRQRECPLGHLRCLTELTPQQVVDALVAV